MICVPVVFQRGQSGYFTDANVALMLGLLFFIIPAYGPSKKYGNYISK